MVHDAPHERGTISGGVSAIALSVGFPALLSAISASARRMIRTFAQMLGALLFPDCQQTPDVIVAEKLRINFLSNIVQIA
jgi:hypothetical protein